MNNYSEKIQNILNEVQKVVKGKDVFLVCTSNDTITSVSVEDPYGQKVISLGGLKIVSKKGIKCTYNTPKVKKYCSTYEFHTPKTKIGKVYIGRVRAYYTLTSDKKANPKLKCTSIKKDYFWQTY